MEWYPPHLILEGVGALQKHVAVGRVAPQVVVVTPVPCRTLNHPELASKFNIFLFRH
jgi:hypothetical protein